jgi:hypothetical protein
VKAAAGDCRLEPYLLRAWPGPGPGPPLRASEAGRPDEGPRAGLPASGVRRLLPLRRAGRPGALRHAGDRIDRPTTVETARGRAHPGQRRAGGGAADPGGECGAGGGAGGSRGAAQGGAGPRRAGGVFADRSLGAGGEDLLHRGDICEADGPGRKAREGEDERWDAPSYG